MLSLVGNWVGKARGALPARIGQDVDVAVELPSVGERRVIANLPEFDLEELLPICEVLCQEGFTAWSLPISRVDEVAALRTAFGRRARIAVGGVTDVAQVKQAAEAGAAFAASDFLLPKLVKAVSGFPVVLGGLTPTELRCGVEAGAAAVQVRPAEAYGADFARALPGMLGYPPLLASGRVKRGLAMVWIEVGAIGVWPEVLFGDDLVVGENLDSLRAHLQLWGLDS
jgi:2-dehydro-3-deoxyphosphogluconate aldolase / (4S)-4-hydroxy-2-oxoglutarate aldolase